MCPRHSFSLLARNYPVSLDPHSSDFSCRGLEHCIPNLNPRKPYLEIKSSFSPPLLLPFNPSLFKGIYHEYTWGRGVVLKQLNYLISMLPIVFRSVDRIVNDHKNDPCQICKFLHFYDSTNCCFKNILKCIQQQIYR